MSELGRPEIDDYHSSRRIRLQTLVRLRWLAVCGQLLTIYLVHVWIAFPLPYMVCGTMIALLASLNFFLSVRYPSTSRLAPRTTFLLLTIDLLELGGLLFVTGGLSNPFAPLLCVPVIISSSAQPIRYTMAVGAVLILVLSVLAFSPYPLPWYPGITYSVPRVILTAIWFAILLMAAFAAFYAYRISMEAMQLSEALAATELVLQRENHLSQLDGLAAAAAHELGTPLATISVVAKEMERELGPDDRFKEDVHLLRSQSERCRDILRRLTTLSADQEEAMKRLPLSSLIEEVTAPHREFGIDIVLEHNGTKAGGNKEGEPIGMRNPGIIYGLGNLIENAVDYARTEVVVTTEARPDKVTVTVKDDGEGYSADILQRIGEPYVTSRSRDDKAGGLGLGLFIAKTLLERSGAKLTFENSLGPGGGARVTVEWPRHRMDVSMTK
jgi:two-component system, sensor histidine kinase RegB